jgi:hypothetical protein
LRYVCIYTIRALHSWFDEHSRWRRFCIGAAYSFHRFHWLHIFEWRALVLGVLLLPALRLFGYCGCNVLGNGSCVYAWVCPFIVNASFLLRTYLAVRSYACVHMFCSEITRGPLELYAYQFPRSSSLNLTLSRPPEHKMSGQYRMDPVTVLAKGGWETPRNGNAGVPRPLKKRSELIAAVAGRDQESPPVPSHLPPDVGLLGSTGSQLSRSAHPHPHPFLTAW